MHLRAPLLLSVLALAVAGLTALPAADYAAGPTATAAANRLGGVNIVALTYGSSPAEADTAIAAAKQLHATVVRTDLTWAVLEPQGPERFDSHALAFVDRLMADAAAAGIKVIATVSSTPCWDSSAPRAVTAACSPTRQSAANAWPPRNSADFASVTAFLAHRYGSDLAAIEIWNEPDQANQLYFRGPNKPQRYAELLRAAYPAIKQADPAVTVLAGSLVGSNGVFLRALYAAGIKGYYDGLAVHFYTLTLGALRSIREVQRANGDTTPLWLDEFGWSSCWPRERIQEQQGCVTAAVQAQNIRDVFRSLASTSFVAAEVLFQLRDRPREDFGVLTQAGRPKPAYAALAQVLASPFGSVSPVTLRLSRHGRQVLAAGSGPVGDFMQLEALQGARLRYRALFTLNRFNRYSIPLPAVLGTSGLTVRVYQYWRGIGRATVKHF